MEREAKAAKKMTKERDRFGVLVTKEIAWADRRIGALASDAALLQGSPRRGARERDIETAPAWRQRLQGDLEALDPAVPGLDWPALKTRVGRDLDVDHPSSMPRLYEKAYGIERITRDLTGSSVGFEVQMGFEPTYAGFAIPTQSQRSRVFRCDSAPMPLVCGSGGLRRPVGARQRPRHGGGCVGREGEDGDRWLEGRWGLRESTHCCSLPR